MKISTKGRYGLRAILDLALHSEGGHVALSNIAERQELSVRYLEQMFSALRKAGIVTSVKGAQGGYTLSREPSRIRVGEILRALEGELTVTDSKQQSPVNNYEYCIKISIWDRLNETVNDIVDSITLEDLVEQFRQLSSDQNFIYYI